MGHWALEGHRPHGVERARRATLGTSARRRWLAEFSALLSVADLEVDRRGENLCHTVGTSGS